MSSSKSARVARTDLPVLVLGENGTGKELVAQAMHTASARRGAFSSINCAAIPANLVESELFGFRKGAFTGADRDSIVTLPALRARKEDLLRLIKGLLARLGRSNAELSVAFVVALVRHDWPFNVRELFAVLSRAVALARDGEPLDAKHLPDSLLVAPSARASSKSATNTAGASALHRRPDARRRRAPRGNAGAWWRRWRGSSGAIARSSTVG